MRVGFIIFFISMAVGLGQVPPPVEKGEDAKGADKTATRVSTNPPVVETTPPATPQGEAKAPEKAPEGVVPPAPAPVSAQTPDAARSNPKGKTPAKNGKNPGVDSSGGKPVFLGVSDKPYIIGPEDILYLNVLHQTDVSGQLNVRPDGFVSVRFAGEVRAAGLTTQQLSDAIADKLKTYFNNPEVNIQVLAVRSKKYYIAGGVRKPGVYTLSVDKTVLEALIEAGGVVEFAKAKKIYILRGQQTIPFNYKEVSAGKNLKQNILLQNGDVIEVPE